jgi:hypothetical protein
VIVLFVTRVKQDSLPQYQDGIGGDLLSWEGENRHGSDDRIARAGAAGDEVHVFYREVHHTPFEYRGTARLLQIDRRTDGPSRFVFVSPTTSGRRTTWPGASPRWRRSATRPSGRRCGGRGSGRAGSGRG